jgi:raffinose/stachyose/melibiose transport system permease protein
MTVRTSREEVNDRTRAVVIAAAGLFLIMLPLMAPVLFVGSVILLISVWGDFFFATFLLPGTARATLPLALYSFATSSVQSFRWNLVFAHVVMSSLPLILAYVFIQRRVIGGLTEGALKG